MRDLLVAAVVFGLIPMVLRRPAVGIYLWCWISYMNPHRLAYGFAFGFPWAYVIALATLSSLFMNKEPKRIPWTRETILLVIFILWMGVTTLNAFYMDAAWEQYTKVLKIQLMTFVTLMVINDRQKLHMLVLVIALSLDFYGIKGGIFTILHGGVYRVQGPMGTFIGGNNEMALALVMTIPLLRYLHLQETRKWPKIGLGVAILLTTLAAVGSQSRGALVGLVVMGALFWVKSRNKFMTALLIIFAIGLAASIMPQAWYDRMHTTENYEQDQSALGRINAWWTAYNVAKDRVTGGGFEMFRAETFRIYAPDPNDVHDVHSIYFMAMGHHGFIGFGMFMMLGWFAWRTCGRVMGQNKHKPERKWMFDLAAMTQVSIIGYAASGAFLGLTYFDLFYHLVAISVILGQLSKQVDEIAVSAPLVQKNTAKEFFSVRASQTV
jgi:probable O-glycosylation ligase (exosortase A-associated)